MDSAPRLRALLFALLALTMVSVGLIVWAGQKGTGTFGPTLLAAGARGQIWTVVNQELLVMDADGRLRQRKLLRELNIEPPLTALAPMGELMMVGSPGDGRVHLLSDQLEPAGELRLGEAGAGALFGVFHLLWDEATQKLVVSDTGNHRLLAFARDSKLVAQVGDAGHRPGAFRFPNGLARDPRGFVLVADTNHHTLHAVNADLSDADWEMHYHAARCDWPASVSVAPGGQTYASWLDSHMRLGTVRQHDSQGVLVRELDLQPDSEPTALLARADDVLIADQSERAYRIHRFDHAGHRLADFGDAQVHAALGEAFAVRQHWTQLRDGARVAAIVFGVLLLAAALLAKHASAPVPGHNERDLGLDPPPPMDWRALLREEWKVYLKACWPLMAVVGFYVALLFGVVDLKPTLKALNRADRHSFHLLMIGIFAIEVLILLGLARLADYSARVFGKTRAARLIYERRSYQMMKGAVKALSYHLYPGETLEAYRAAAGYSRPLLLIATNLRLLSFPVAPIGAAKIRWQAEWKYVSGVTQRPLSGWQSWVVPGLVKLEVTRADPAGSPLRLVCRQTLAGDLQAMIAAGCKKWPASTPNATAAPPSPTALDVRPARTIRLVLLSMLWPGLAQMDQGRVGNGVALMLLGGAMLGMTILSWTVYLKRIADQPLMQPFLLLAVYCVVALLAIGDALGEERGRR